MGSTNVLKPVVVRHVLISPDILYLLGVTYLAVLAKVAFEIESVSKLEDVEVVQLN
jgi:hypothetical protein